jgi:hypothetical protein
MRGNTFKSIELDALEEAINISMTFHAALASSGMIFVTPHIICVN